MDLRTTLATETGTFSCGDERLVYVAHPAAADRAVGVVIVVGGPNYRVGSHRQFVLLARTIAEQGFPVFRFDYRGMGDSEGGMRSFEDVNDDLRAATSAFRRIVPGVERVLLYGLCDGASAALFFAAVSIEEVAGLVLVNPWMPDERSAAETQVKKYYSRRLLSPEPYKKLLRGDLSIPTLISDLRALAGKLVRVRERGKTQTGEAPLIDRMAHAWRSFDEPILLITSSEDLTAQEFLTGARRSSAWAELLNASNVKHVVVEGANHTMSALEWRETMFQTVVHWLERHYG